MDNVFKLIYWSLGAFLFVIAVSFLMYSDNIFKKEYKNILYTDSYAEVYKIR